MEPRTLAASAVVGLATGPRSFTALAAVALVTPRHASAQPDRVLGHPTVKALVGAVALQEWVMDKLPGTPSRLEPLGLVTRATGAAGAAAILARRAQVTKRRAAAEAPNGLDDAGADPSPYWRTIGACAATGAITALATAVVGVRLRHDVGRLVGRDWPSAALEDVSSAVLAAASVRILTARAQIPSPRTDTA